MEIEIVGAAGVPLTLVEKAIQSRQSRPRRARNSFELHDQVWVVFDRDQHPNIPEARAKASAHGVRIAFCNPCFELWLLLHIRDFDAPVERGEMQRLLEKELPAYSRRRGKSLPFSALEAGIDEACARADAMRKRRIDDGAEFGPPYTDADILVEVISANGADRKASGQ